LQLTFELDKLTGSGDVASLFVDCSVY